MDLLPVLFKSKWSALNGSAGHVSVFEFGRASTMIGKLFVDNVIGLAEKVINSHFRQC